MWIHVEVNRKISSLALLLLLGIAPTTLLAKKSDNNPSGSHSVNGYVKKDGTYVQPHRATNPNQTQRDNWSSKPNVNPYTGKKGTKEPQK